MFVTGPFTLPIFFLWPLQTGKVTAHFENLGASPSLTDISSFKTNKKNHGRSPLMTPGGLNKIGCDLHRQKIAKPQ